MITQVSNVHKAAYVSSVRKANKTLDAEHGIQKTDVNTMTDSSLPIWPTSSPWIEVDLPGRQETRLV